MDIIDLAKKDLSIILISHDLNLLKDYCNKIYQLSNNKLVLKTTDMRNNRNYPFSRSFNQL